MSLLTSAFLLVLTLAPAQTSTPKSIPPPADVAAPPGDATMFDSSVTSGKPAVFPVNRVIAGFSEGLKLMVPGEKRRLWIPESLAYKGVREPKGMLVFDVELVDMPSRPPPDVNAPPSDARKTA